MTKYKRITGKVFGGNATATGDDPQIAQFGSALANTFIGTTDPEVIQQLPAWGQGWIGAVTPDTQFPALPEMTGAMKVLSHQICTAEQEGVSSWDSGTVYYEGNFVSKNKKLFVSLTDENQGNDPETDQNNWQEFTRELQEQLALKTDKAQAAHAVMPSDKKISITPPASKSSGPSLSTTELMVAPTDGYANVAITINNANGVAWVYTTPGFNQTNRLLGVRNYENFCTIVIKKGNTLNLRGAYVSKIDVVEFIPCVGTESEVE